ncbi:MAG TPA: hypothetical protein VF819_08120 [Nitrospira sp.]
MLNLTSAVFALLTTLWTATLLSYSPASAGQPKERIALMLTGSDCREAQQPIEIALQQTDEVFAVDGNSVPHHLLIDVEEGTSAHDVLTIVRAINTVHSCQIEVMQSCITAPRPTKTATSEK